MFKVGDVVEYCGGQPIHNSETWYRDSRLELTVTAMAAHKRAINFSDKKGRTAKGKVVEVFRLKNIQLEND